MKTCKDCIHYKICKDSHPIIVHFMGGICGFYKDKSLFVELPCHVGDTVYIPYRGLGENKRVLEDEVLFFDNFDDVTINTNWLSSGKLGVDVFLTREEAEKSLKERYDKVLKPIEAGYDNGSLICPQCGYILCFNKANRAAFQSLHMFESCTNCNQKLDWSDEE